MLLSLNWLRDYLQKSDAKIDPYQLAEKLTMLGLPVAAIKTVTGQGLDNVVVGRIEKIEKHPNADRLQITQVITSVDGQPRQIVCGAKNIAVGDIVPVALPGAVLPGDFEIKVSQIRGVESLGMLCSGKELGLGEDSEGILALPKHSQLGDLVAHLLGGGHNEDTVLEFELTPNRPDCLSVLGMAREIAPLLKTKVREPKPARFRISAHRTSSIIKLEVDDPVVCPRYVARVIDGLKVTKSPEWIEQRLQAVGIRPINNIVDITNFVMFEYGQPLHAFDLRKIESGTLRVARANKHMTMELLNDQMVAIEPDDILILDGDRPIALAGIMGGKNSQIEEDTTSIILESACFPAAQIRKTAKRLGLITEASKRFEKGVDLMAVAVASERAGALLRDGFNANVYHPGIDSNENAYQEQTLALDMRDVRNLTGMRLAAETVSDLFETVGIESFRKSSNVLTIKLPSFRLDLRESIDLVEEVARLAGYENIPERFPISQATYHQFDESSYEFERQIRSLLRGLGLRETIHYSFTSEEILRRYGYEKSDAVVIKNPISEEMKVMRTGLLPSLVESYIFNKNRKAKNQKIFEVARVYAKDAEEETGVKESSVLAGLLSGAVLPATWRPDEKEVDFYHAKGIIEHLFQELTTVIPVFEPLKHHKLFHPNRSAVIKLGLREIGFVGEVHPFLKKKFLESTESVVAFELSLDALKKYLRSNIRYQAPSKYPGTEFDLAFTVDNPVTSQGMIETMRTAGGNLLHQVKIFDMYQGEHVAKGKKSLAFRLTFSSGDRTLQDAEVAALRDKIIQSVTEKHSAQLRG